jgi:hypothetical protein
LFYSMSTVYIIFLVYMGKSFVKKTFEIVIYEEVPV